VSKYTRKVCPQNPISSGLEIFGGSDRGAVVWILIFIFMVFDPLPSKCLLVNWKRPNAVVWKKSPCSNTFEAYVRTPAQFFVNGEEVDRNELSSKLIEQLGRPAEWAVYFEADADTSYMDALYAIDVIQGWGARLVWVTPKMPEHWPYTPESSPKNSGMWLQH
jgi:biopolymer transport protein ExbD